MKIYTRSSKIMRIAIVMALLLVGLTAQTASAQVVLPVGTTITQATLSIYAYANVDTPTVNLHRITSDWGENTVTWNNFAGRYDPAVVASFHPSSEGWYTVDITSLVQAWANGTYPNYGVLLEQGQTLYTMYHSSDYADTSYRPKLNICYTVNGQSACVTIQRSSSEQDSVADAYLWMFNPDTNYGTSAELFTGMIYGFEKQSLLRFFFEITPPPAGEGCTPGYWKNHLGSWAATGYATTNYFDTVFGVTYFSPTYTLLQAINQGGGGLDVIARHGTAALLSAAHPGIDYPYTVAEVIAMVKSGKIDPLITANNMMCPIS
jgi:hypothetical protein